MEKRETRETRRNISPLIDYPRLGKSNYTILTFSKTSIRRIVSIGQAFPFTQQRWAPLAMTSVETYSTITILPDAQLQLQA